MPCIFLGYPDGIKGWRCYDPVARNIIISRDVILNEHKFPGLSRKSITSGIPVSISLNDHKVTLPAEDPDDEIASAAEPPPVPDVLAEPNDTPAIPDAPPPPEPVQPEPAPDAVPPAAAAPAPAPVQKPKSRRTNMGPPPAPTRTSSRSKQPPTEWWKVPNAEKYRDPPPPVAETDDEREEEPEAEGAQLQSTKSH